VAGSGDGLGPAVGAELGVQVAHLRLDGVERDVQFAGDFRPRQVGRQVAQYAQFALAQRLHRQPRPRGRRRGSVSGQQAEDLSDQGGVGGAVLGLTFQQTRNRVQQEWHQRAVGLGEVEGVL
jgi:hypothetical protein